MNDQMNSGHAVSRYKRFRDETAEEFLKRRKSLLGYKLIPLINEHFLYIKEPSAL